MEIYKPALFFFSCLCCINIIAQNRLTGKVRNAEKENLSGVVVSLQQDTILIGATLTDTSGNYMFDDLRSGKYRLIATALGLEPKGIDLNIQSNMRQDLVVEYQSFQLDEVTVTADKSNLIISDAMGTTFHLSNRAKTLKDPFEALLEVPKLSVIPSLRKVTLSDGTVPLILVNGNRVNGGVESIDPKRVESIEIIETPSARYLKDGVQAIVNFKMKRQEVVYHSLNASTIHSIPFFYGLSNVYYETGNKNASLNLSAQHWYFYNDDATINNFQQNVRYSKWRESGRSWNAQRQNLALNGDWICSSKDYLAFKVIYINNPSKYVSTGKGELIEKEADIQNFTFFNEDKVVSYINSYNLYYKHTLHEKSQLEATARFNLNGNETKGVRSEDYTSWRYEDIYDFDNFRYSGGFEIYYTAPLGKHTLDVGSETSFLSDRIRQVYAGYPTFYHRNIDEYAFVGLSSKFNKKFSYTLSVGYEMIFRKVGGVNYDYNKPAGNLSLNWRMNSFHTIGASYNLRHTTPEVGQLNPYNTSTDSLMRQEGNPFLLPSQSQQWKLRYSYNKGGFFIEPSVSYISVTDAIEQVGQTDESTGIYLSTYENSTHYSFLSGSVNLRYNNSKWGGFNLGIENLTRFYERQSGKNLFKYNFNLYGWYKRLSWNGYLWYTPIDYGVHTKSKYRGAESELRLVYKLNRSFSVSAGMRYLLGKLKTESSRIEGTYFSFNTVSMDDRSWKVLFGVSYSYQKEKSPNRKKKYLDTKESGIIL